METAQTATHRIRVASLQIATPLYDLVQDEIAPGTGIEANDFWYSLAKILEQFTTFNDALLTERVEIQKQIDSWHRERHGRPIIYKEYLQFLRDIGYILPEGEPFSISPKNIDPEIATIAGPQLVVPVNNARYALNAANARWGSLFDALYGTDALGEGMPSSQTFDMDRGKKVVAYAMSFLDDIAPLNRGSHADVDEYMVRDHQFVAKMQSGEEHLLAEPEKFVGYNMDGETVSAILLRNNDLHVEIKIKDSSISRALSPARVYDLVMESAVTTIQDCEDSVAAVDAGEKVLVYRNWLKLMKGDLEATFDKNGKKLTRKLDPDRQYTDPDGNSFMLPGRSLMLVRNVGHHMKTDAVLDTKGEEVYEGILDCLITAFCALHDLNGQSEFRNSATGSIYIAKPKMHGPQEVKFIVDLMTSVEKVLGLKKNTLKLGIMDEERRTSVNLKECLRMARDRLIFINTGFLDRTGDEIHTSMEAGPMIRKQDMRSAKWLNTYEDWNVAVGLQCGMMGKAQIGKGMWTKPDKMHDMMQTKQEHLQAGASCAWVPSPTAATLHALHYHRINVKQCQKELLERSTIELIDMLSIPVNDRPDWTPEQVQQELDNNLQGILGYVVRWVEQGVGASKVPDINHIGLMEDRATLRISSQHVANWLYHGIVTDQQVFESLQRMARVVDEQNADDPLYIRMAPQFNGPAFNAAKELIFKGRQLPNGYTISILNYWRRRHKRALLQSST